MKISKKAAKRITVCSLCALFVAIVILIIVLLAPVSYNGMTDFIFSNDAAKNFYNQSENEFNVLIFGSSHSWNGIVPAEMDKYGVNAYNFSNSNQLINTTELFVNDAFSTQKPKVIIIETFFVNSIEKNSDINTSVLTTKNIKDKSARCTYLKEAIGFDVGNYIEYFFPFFKFHDNWSNLDEENFEPPSYIDHFEKNRGHTPLNGVKEVDINVGEALKEQKELSSRAIECLDGISRICRENGTKIIFITTPYEGEYHYSDAVNKYAAENDWEYINFFEKIDELGIDCKADFSDPEHLNQIGAAKVSDYLGKYISENYEL